VVALSGELTQNERTQALQALRDGRARVCVATDVAARGIDLPNLDLVIHSDLAERRGGDAASLRPHRASRPQGCQRVVGAAGATGGGRNCCSTWRASDAVWGKAPGADEIRKLDQERMLQDTLFAEATTDEDLVLARAMLAERSPEDIAAGTRAALSGAVALTGGYSRSRPGWPFPRRSRSEKRGTAVARRRS